MPLIPPSEPSSPAPAPGSPSPDSPRETADSTTPTSVRLPRFGELEEQVMIRLWAAGRPLQVREVRESLLPDREPAHTTVMTVLDNLYRKGLLRREMENRAYRYEPVMSREAYTASTMHEAWAFSESPATALVYFIETMTPEQLTALRDALRVIPPDHRARVDD